MDSWLGWGNLQAPETCAGGQVNKYQLSVTLNGAKPFFWKVPSAGTQSPMSQPAPDNSPLQVSISVRKTPAKHVHQRRLLVGIMDASPLRPGHGFEHQKAERAMVECVTEPDGRCRYPRAVRLMLVLGVRAPLGTSPSPPDSRIGMPGLALPPPPPPVMTRTVVLCSSAAWISDY